MKEEIANLVHPVFNYGLRLKERLARGEASDMETEQATLKGLLLGENEAQTPLRWHALEEIPDFLRGRDWVRIGSAYSTGSHLPGSLDEHLKNYTKTATAGWVAVLLEKAAVITIDRSRPARIRLRPGW